MVVLSAKQMIFTRVESEYSPQRKSGYQTVYRSNGLSASDVKTIEKRVQCFQTNDPSLVRRQFFTLESGQVVLTHSITIESHPQIVDKNRRGGVFLAHCLIFNQNEFELAHNNPFKIFEAFRFLDNAEAMVEQFNQSEGRESECRIKLNKDSRPSGGERWSSAEAIKLVAFAEQAAALKAKPQSLFFYGSTEDIDQALRALFSLALKKTRLACTFDTHIEQCVTRPGLYWAVGAPSRPGRSYILINAALRQVEDSAPGLDMNNMYLAWLQHVAGRNSHQIMAQAPTIEELSQAFEECRRTNQAMLDKEACESFFALHKKHIMQELRVALSSATSQRLGRLLAEHLLNIGDKKALIDIAASQSPILKELSWNVTVWLGEQAPEFATLKRNDWKALQKLAHRAPNNTLLFWAAVLGNDKKLREEALMKMDSGEFKRALQLILNPIAPANFVTPRHLTTLLGEVRLMLASIQDEQFVELVRTIIAVGGSSHLDGRLARRVPNLENKALTDLEKELQKSGHVSKGFLQAVRIRRKELGTPAGLRGRLSELSKKWFGRK